MNSGTENNPLFEDHDDYVEVERWEDEDPRVLAHEAINEFNAHGMDWATLLHDMWLNYIISADYCRQPEELEARQTDVTHYYLLREFLEKCGDVQRHPL